MESGDILNYSLSIGFLALMGFSCYAILYVVKVLKHVLILMKDFENVADRVNKITSNVESLTEDLGEGLKANPLLKFIGLFRKK